MKIPVFSPTGSLVAPLGRHGPNNIGHTGNTRIKYNVRYIQRTTERTLRGDGRVAGRDRASDQEPQSLQQPSEANERIRT